MLIAIMGDTFAQASEQADNNARITKLEIMEDYIHLIVHDIRNAWEEVNSGSNNDESAAKFLYAVITDEEVAQMNTWEGQMNSMKKVTEQIVSRNSHALQQKLDRLSERMALSETNEDI